MAALVEPIMLRNPTYIITIAAVVLIGIIGFAAKQDVKTAQTYPDQTLAVDAEVSVRKAETRQDVKSSTEPTQAERKLAYEQSLLATLQASLRDVPAPERLDVDSAGNLVINAKIRKMFDHYLSTAGEEELPRITERVKLLLTRQLSDPALSQANEIFDNYIEFKGATDMVLQQSAPFQSGQLNAQAIASLKQQVRQIRSRYFSPDVVEAFFAREDQYDDYMLAKSQITNNETLSGDAKVAEISRLNQKSPAWLSQRSAQARQIETYRAKESALLESSAQGWEIKDLRRREFGEEAAAKLELRDERRADWDQRLAAYRTAVDAAMQQVSDPNGAYADATRDKIRAEHFKDHELRRVLSLDAITTQD